MPVYETLPLDLRARVENWSIKSDEIRFHNENVLDVSAGHKLCGPLKATYRWVDVVVNVYHLDLDDDTCCSHRLQNEIRALAQLRHPHIASFLGASIAPNACFVVTEFLPGGTLVNYYAQRRANPSTLRQPWRAGRGQALEWALGLARAINYMHMSEPRVVHGGLRPDRLLLTASGALKISAFGNCTIGSPAADCRARQSDAADPETQCPAPAAVEACEACYLAPEQLRPAACACGGEPERCGPAVDIHAAASCIWFMRTGHHPNAAIGGAAGARKVGWARLARIVEAGWASDPAGRPSAEEILGRLEALCDAAAGPGACAVG
jgi:serine/threonine protein kinase